MAEAARGTLHSVEGQSLQALEWRSLGPFRGGRVVAVAGHPTEFATFYMGSTGGGIWKTEDGGVYWENISDGYFKRASVGAIAIAESDPNVIYVGMGESTIRNDVSHGDGVYKSTDGGKTWKQMGLAETRNIGKVRVHPKNADLVYVAALGHAHGPNPERGVYRSKDGGQSWELVLFRSEEAGAVDLSIDADNPRVMYAAFWQGVHRAHELSSGGPGSGIFRSSDGGDSWEELSRKPGMTAGMMGRIGISASPAKPGRVWALVEAKDGGVFRSDDYGETWKNICASPEVRQRPWYYMHIFADPENPETVRILNLAAWESFDGGKSFNQFAGPHGDYHDIWIDPKNNRRRILGHDGGASVSFNAGQTWSNIYNQPTMEFYHVSTDTQEPYRIYGAQQDNTTVSLPSRGRHGAIQQGETYEVGGGESGYIAVRPDNPNIVYAGSYAGAITRFDHASGERHSIHVWPEEVAGWGAKDVKYRFQWTFPIVLSPYDPNVLYVTSNHVHRTANEGKSWEIISPDLTRNDQSKQAASGGPITIDSNGMDFYCTIFAFDESKVRQGVLWAGSDDGLIHVSQDGGNSWQDVTPPDMPTWSLVSIIEPSPHDAARAYVAVDRHRHDDFAPYFYKTDDYGQSWTKIVEGIPGDDFARTIREDPEQPGLLYAGTETGIYVSFDDGGHWQSLKLNMPVVPVHDLTVKDGDLIAATHGRAFWVLDDLTALRQLAASPDLLAEPAHLFPPRTATRYWSGRGFGQASNGGKAYQSAGTTMFAYRTKTNAHGETTQIPLDAGQNPPDGVVVFYNLKEKPAEDGEVTLSFLDAAGNVIKRYSSNEQPEPAKGERKEPRVHADAGLNRFVWDMHYPDARNVPGAIYRRGGVAGPLAPPGHYQARLEVGGQQYTQSFEIRKDPRVSASQQDLEAQFALAIQVRDKLSETNDAINRLRAMRDDVNIWDERLKNDERAVPAAEAAEAIKSKLDALEEDLRQTSWKASRDALTAPSKLNAKLATLSNDVASGDGAPTEQAFELLEVLSRQVAQHRDTLNQVVNEDVPHFNELVRNLDLPALKTEE